MDVYPTSAVIQPIAFQDVGHEDTFGTIAASLKTLLHTTDAVFGRIETRVAHERARLNAINSRLARCREKVRLVSSTARAVTLFAVPKFPAADVARHSGVYLTLHDGIHHPVADVDDPSGGLAPIGALPLEKTDMSPDDEVLTRPDRRAGVVNLFARISLAGGQRGGGEEASAAAAANAAAALAASSSAAATTGGLGALPAYLPSVCSMLLFNSKQRPYKEQKTLDDLIYGSGGAGGGGGGDGDGSAGQGGSGDGSAADMDDGELLLPSGRRRRVPGSAKKDGDADGARKLGSAPKTFLDGDTLPALAPVEYGYRPKVRNVDAFALPSNLALPNVADIAWGQAAVSSIAPSAVRNEQPQLPTILDLMPPPPPMPSAAAAPAAAGAASFPAPPSLPALPAPETMLALPPIPGPSNMAAAAMMPPAPPQPPSAPSGGPPRPPGPPPPPAGPPPPTPGGPSSAPAMSSPPPSSGADGGRSSLLSALTNPDNLKRLKKRAPEGAEGEGGAGGAGEGSSAAAPAPAPAPKGKAAAPEPVSMMDEMAKKLALRRKAMVGDANGAGPAAGAGAKPAATAPPQSPARPGGPPKPPGPPSSAASVAGGEASGGGGSTGIFRPESMHGFKMSTATKPKGKGKRKDDSDDDWGDDSDSD